MDPIPPQAGPDAPTVDRESAELDASLHGAIRRISHINDPRQLCDAAFAALEFLLRRKSDQDMLAAMSEMVAELISRIPFDGSPSEIQAATRQAGAGCIRVLLTARAKRPARPASGDPAGRGADKDDLEYYVPPHLSHLLERVDYDAPTPPPPQKGFANFEDLCEAAILHRVERLLAFFQRSNRHIVRELPKPFLASPDWAKKFNTAIKRFIFPAIRGSRQIRVLSPSMDWVKVDTENFWANTNDQLKDKIMLAWTCSWDSMKLINETNEDGANVAKIKKDTKELREILAPADGEDYDLPKITNVEVELLKSLLNVSVDWWAKLTETWAFCHDLYEQEMDPRVFQQQAREGALRDGLLARTRELPDQWGEFLVLTCHRVFPRIDTAFLERFSMSVGRNETQRAQRMPYLMRYLAQVGEHPAIRSREAKEAAEWKLQRQQLRSFLSGRQSTE